MQQDVFRPRLNFKPFVYTWAVPFKEAIHQSPWTHKHFNFGSDVQDFRVHLTAIEKSIIRKTLLAISQVEVGVKDFWPNNAHRFPVPELKQVFYTFADSEVRHADAYSHLLEVLGFNDDFSTLLQETEMQGRVDYLTDYLRGAKDKTDEDYSLTLALFSLFIENVSLFSQFAIMKSFYRHRNKLKEISNVVQATQKEETIHALFGAYLINVIREEHPEWFGERFRTELVRACNAALRAESKILDWVFRDGELDFLPKASLIEFLKHRFNESVKLINEEPVFQVNHDLLMKHLHWFFEEERTDVNTDFFHQRAATYSIGVQSFTADDLF